MQDILRFPEFATRRYHGLQNRPFARALGAKSVAGELRLLCRAHNLRAAREVLGRAFIDRRIHERRSTRPRQDACTERPRCEALPTQPSRAEGGS
jgi:hypothetical protein